MARRTLALLAIFWYLSVVCEGGIHRITYNEYDLVGRCSSTCAKLPDRTDKFGCDRISNCKFKRKGWKRGFFSNCNWCICDCATSEDKPQKEVIEQTKKIYTEMELWNTCRKTCDASGLQKTDSRGCSEIRDCRRQKKGWIRWFTRCDYCECTCVIKGYPYIYRLENVTFNISPALPSVADSVVVGKVTVENHSSREQTFTRTISTSIETTRMWERTSSTTLPVGVTVSISAPTLNIATLEVTTTRRTEEYTWGETKAWINTFDTTQEVTVGPNCTMEASMVGTHYQASIPYTADLVTTYDNDRETRKSISGILHEATVYNVHLVYGKCIPITQTTNN